MRIMRFALVLAVVLVVAGRAPGAWACSCAPPGSVNSFDRADVVFTGDVVSKHDPAKPGEVVSSGRMIRWTFDVRSVQKGKTADPQVVESAADGASCGYSFTVGRRYKVYADRDGGALRTNLCAGNQALGAGELAATGEPLYPLAIGMFLVVAGCLVRRVESRSVAG